MEKIAVLGPVGTFSDNAVKKYIDVYDLDMEPVYYPSIDKTFHAAGPVFSERTRQEYFQLE